jgi:transcriptional regulator with XRE-family HTH domain
MLYRINSIAKAIWKKMLNKEYRDAFIVAHNSNTIAAQINAMRQARGWTQEDLASKCGMRQPRISALEDPDFENVEIITLQRLASAFDVGLSVSFVAFSEIARKSTSLESSDFNVPEFSKDGLAARKQDNSIIFWNIKMQLNSEASKGDNSLVIDIPQLHNPSSEKQEIIIPPGQQPHDARAYAH